MERASSKTQRRFVWLYALAFLGVHFAFLPMIVLLLPRRVEAITQAAGVSGGLAGELAGAGTMLSWLLLAGGIAASITHILAGHWSDRWIVRHGSRRGLIAIGVGALVVSYLGMSVAYDFPTILAGFIGFQIALNLCFAPLGALLADHVPDESKGITAGLMNAALPLSSLGIAAFAWAFPVDGAAAFLMIALLVAALIGPLLISGKFGSATERPSGEIPASKPSPVIRDYSLVWLARFLIQMGATFVISYLYLYISKRAGPGSLWPDKSVSALIADVSLVASLLAIFAAVMLGRMSDLSGKRKMPLVACALLAGAALLALAGEPSWIIFATTYGLFHFGLTGFLAVDTALVAQLLAGNPRRGALLGIMNLTNTLPAILVPAIALSMFAAQEPLAGLDAIFRYCAIGAVAAAAAVMLIRRIK